MKLLTNYIQSFLSRDGSYIFLATISAKGLSFIASWIALQLISNKELGVVLFAFSIIQFLKPIGGFGLHQSLIRYGALLKEETDKDTLFVYVFNRGLGLSFLLVAIIILASFFIPFKFEKTSFYLATLSLIIVSGYLLSVIQIQLRLKHNNKLFAYTEILHSIILVFSVLLLSYFFKENGYVAALILTPLATGIIFFFKLNIKSVEKYKLKVVDTTFWKYGFFASLTGVIGELLVVVDILLIGILISNSEDVTSYRYISIIPLSILFLPKVFVNTDFVTFTEKIFDRSYIYKYIKGYMTLFTAISIVVCILSYSFSEDILMLFDQKFVKFSGSFVILIIGVSSILIFRGLFGNLLCSIGKININLYISLISIAFNIVGNYYLIPKYGIKGAAITSAFIMWFASIITAISFLYLYKKKLAEKNTISKL